MSCNQSKKSCDGSRPCSRCIQNNESCIDQQSSSKKPRRVTRACVSCVKAKVKCQSQRPCERCNMKRISCVDDDTMKHITQDEMVPFEDDMFGFGIEEKLLDAFIEEDSREIQREKEKFLSLPFMLEESRETALIHRNVMQRNAADIYFLQYEQTPALVYGDILNTVIENSSPMDLDEFVLQNTTKWKIFWKHFATSVHVEKVLTLKEKAVRNCLQVSINPDEVFSKALSLNSDFSVGPCALRVSFYQNINSKTY
jgi:hypothetical protein